MTSKYYIPRLNVFGDNFMKRMCPIIKKRWIGIDREVTIRRGTIAELYYKILDIYDNVRNKRKYMKNTALIMIGTYDIKKFRKRYVLEKFSKMKRNLKKLIGVLKKYHRHIIILTVQPVVKLKGKRLQLLETYNEHIRGLSDKRRVSAFDMTHIFRGKGCVPGVVQAAVWNRKRMTRALSELFEYVVNVPKLQSSYVQNKIEKEEICRDRTIMTRKLEDVCLEGDGPQCTGINYFTENGVLDRNARVCLQPDQGQMGYSRSTTPEEPTESIYSANTVHLLPDIKQKLSWIRFTDYTYYGRELIKSNKIQSIENELLTIATYNVLSQELLEKHNYLYSDHDHRSLKWSTRRDILLEELTLLDADILCLQEVDSNMLRPFYDNFFYERGYEGVYKRRTHGKIDGCAIYFRTNKFNLVESSKIEFFNESARLLDRDNVGIVLKLSLKERENMEIIVATTHLLYNPKRADIKLAQTQMMLAEIERLAYKGIDPITGEAEYLPILFTGDMNYSPESAVYQLVTKSHLEYAGLSRKCLSPYNDGSKLNKVLLPARVGVTDSCQYLSSVVTREGKKTLKFETGTLQHQLNLSSVYSHVKNDYPEATTNQTNWLTVDYIFYSQTEDGEMKSRKDGQLKLISKLTLPNTMEAETELANIPNLGCASDHLPLLATFHLTGS